MTRQCPAPAMSVACRVDKPRRAEISYGHDGAHRAGRRLRRDRAIERLPRTASGVTSSTLTRAERVDRILSLAAGIAAITAVAVSSLGRGSVLAPGAQRAVLTLPTGDRAQAFWLQVQTRFATVMCYCSVYDECWVADSREPEPREVKACAADSTSAFGQ